MEVRVNVSLSERHVPAHEHHGLGLRFDFTFEVRPSETSKNGLGLGLDFTLEVHVAG